MQFFQYPSTKNILTLKNKCHNHADKAKNHDGHFDSKQALNANNLKQSQVLYVLTLLWFGILAV